MLIDDRLTVTDDGLVGSLIEIPVESNRTKYLRKLSYSGSKLKFKT